MTDMLSRYMFPFRLNNLLEDDDELMAFSESTRGGLSVSEDDNHVYIEAAVPGIEPDKIDVTYKKGVLWIKAAKEEKEEDKDKKFYRHSQQDFQYRVSVPGNVDESKDPESNYKNGIVKITFNKRTEEEPKKIAVKKD